MQNEKQIFPDNPRWFVSWLAGMLTCNCVWLVQVSGWHLPLAIAISAALVSITEVARSCRQDERYGRAHEITLEAAPVDEQVEVLWLVLDDMVGGRDASVQVVARYLAGEKEARVG